MCNNGSFKKGYDRRRGQLFYKGFDRRRNRIKGLFKSKDNRRNLARDLLGRFC